MFLTSVVILAQGLALCVPLLHTAGNHREPIAVLPSSRTRDHAARIRSQSRCQAGRRRISAAAPDAARAVTCQGSSGSRSSRDSHGYLGFVCACHLQRCSVRARNSEVVQRLHLREGQPDSKQPLRGGACLLVRACWQLRSSAAALRRLSAGRAACQAGESEGGATDSSFCHEGQESDGTACELGEDDRAALVQSVAD